MFTSFILPCRIPVIALLFLLASLSAPACRIIIDPPRPRPRPMPLPPPIPREMQTRKHNVTITISRHIARVHIQAVFYNPNSRRLAGTYWFPVSPDAAVSSFAMSMNGKVVEAELLPAKKARRIYEDIVRRLRDPALLEYINQGMLRARVFPIEPRSEVTVSLDYEQKLTRNGSLTHFRYPLLSTRPGVTAARIGKLSIQAEIQTTGKIKTLFTPGLTTRIKRLSDHRASVSMEAANYLPDRDFEIIFSEGGGRVGLDMLTTRKPGEEEGYFLLSIAPDSELQKDEIRAKNMILVMDTSGSMGGKKIKQARKALRFCVQNLDKADFFTILSFSTDVTPFREKPVPATRENRDAALDFIDHLRARGGTAIHDALLAALEAFRQTPNAAKDATPLLVFITDGRPTIGEIDPDIIIRDFQKQAGKQRVFTFGIGYDVNTRLLNSLASACRGFTRYVRPGENLEIALSSFYEKIASPVLTDLNLDSAGVAVSSLTPWPLPDLFKGAEIMVFGRYHGRGTHAMRLSGKVGDTEEIFPFSTNLDGDSRNAFIPRMWATSRVGQLLEAIRRNGQKAELVEEIRRLGRTYGILTPYTSFLVVEEALDQQTRREVRRRLGNENRPASESGQNAVKSAEADQSMARGNARAAGVYAKKLGKILLSAGSFSVGGNASVASPPSLRKSHGKLDQIVKKIADKTFYYRVADGRFYDSLIPAGSSPAPDSTVTAWSPEFFALLRRYPKLRHYLLAGENLVIRLGDRIIRIEKATTGPGK